MNLINFWTSNWGCAFFQDTMSYHRFQEILQFLSFDKKETRDMRLQENRFALVSEIWEICLKSSWQNQYK